MQTETITDHDLGMDADEVTEYLMWNAYLEALQYDEVERMNDYEGTTIYNLDQGSDREIREDRPSEGN